MASATCSEDLTCCICLTIFSDPVMLFCGHSFCRECIIASLKSQSVCPLCQTAVSVEQKCLPTNHILKRLAEKAKEKCRKKENAKDREVSEWLCPEHDEKLKLFCVTEQQLTCVICRDGEKHDGHKFKPIKEATASVRQELEKLMQHVSDDICVKQNLTDSQREEIAKSKQKSQDLMNQISTQFEEMHQFLRKREEEIKNDLKHKEDDDVKKMTESLSALQTVLSEEEELKRKVTSVLQITESERFLKTCSDEEMMTAEHLFKATSKDLNVVNSSLNLGPFESHLQFFVWKEMLQMINPREEKLRVARDSKNVTVSYDGKSFFPIPTTSAPRVSFSHWNQQQATGGFAFGQSPLRSTGTFGPAPPMNSSFGFGMQAGRDEYNSFSLCTNDVFSIDEFTSGQHYWEIEVGQRDFWKLGIINNYLIYDRQKYAICTENTITKITFTDRPKKIGVYLNCFSKELSFYDGNNMKHIHTLKCPHMSSPVSAFVGVVSKTPDFNPLTVCWY